jgi:hypothetical protein
MSRKLTLRIARWSAQGDIKVVEKRHKGVDLEEGHYRASCSLQSCILVLLSLGLPLSRYLLHKRLNGIDQTSIIRVM